MSLDIAEKDPRESQIVDTIVNGFDHDYFLNKIVRLAPGILYVFNHRTQSNEYANRSIAELLGYSVESIQAMGDTLLARVIHPDDLHAIGGHFASLNALQDGEISTFEYRAIAEDGEIVWLRSHDTVFERDETGKLVRHIGVASDVTVEKTATIALMDLNQTLERRIAARTGELAALNAELDERVKARTAELLESNDELEQLTYITTHDLKVPINNLCRMADMLAGAADAMPPAQAKLVELSRRAAYQTHQKLDALVQVAKARSKEVAPFKRLDFDRTLSATLDLLGHEIETTGATIDADFAQAPTVSYDPSELDSIFQNMIGNALKFTRDGVPPIVTLRSWIADGAVHLSVGDNGTGLSLPADLEKVFGLFRTAHTSVDGNGIALYSIRKRLHRAGGNITVASPDGAGTAFTLTFPVEDRTHDTD